jgi:tRNA-2-methylthio-N6-dimethylallyladenosine synthase
MEQYYNIINNIRKYIPEASITTDVMVGFPGEKEGDFQETVKTFQNIQFDSAYTFIYSNRKETLSSFFGQEVTLLTKKKRLWTLLKIQKNITTRINQHLIGKTIEILVENKSKKGIEKQYWGKTRTNKIVVFSCSDDNNDLLGKLVNVEIKQADSYTLFGELVDVKY